MALSYGNCKIFCKSGPRLTKLSNNKALHLSYNIAQLATFINIKTDATILVHQLLHNTDAHNTDAPLGRFCHINKIKPGDKTEHDGHQTFNHNCI